ncbi:hypothetical protein DFJ74DRAFT_676806 [Hyaloraphidium curvatum]|nr:hypothetical protein DFJ74DRAFT_676806 [Hyaloraphidium curvatum]
MAMPAIAPAERPSDVGAGVAVAVPELVDAEVVREVVVETDVLANVDRVLDVVLKAVELVVELVVSVELDVVGLLVVVVVGDVVVVDCVDVVVSELLVVVGTAVVVVVGGSVVVTVVVGGGGGSWRATNWLAAEPQDPSETAPAPAGCSMHRLVSALWIAVSPPPPAAKRNWRFSGVSCRWTRRQSRCSRRDGAEPGQRPTDKELPPIGTRMQFPEGPCRSTCEQSGESEGEHSRWYGSPPPLTIWQPAAAHCRPAPSAA